MWSFPTASTRVNALTSTSRPAPLRRLDFSRRCNEVYCFAADRQVHPTPSWRNASTHGNISWTQIVKQVMYVSDNGCIMFSQEQSTVSNHLFRIPAEGTIQSYVMVVYWLEFLQLYCVYSAVAWLDYIDYSFILVLPFLWWWHMALENTICVHMCV